MIFPFTSLGSLCRPLRWLARFPYRKGYGVHSPFAFQFITGVIYERGEYYSYRFVDTLRFALRLRRKDCRLLMRLANFWQAKNTLLYGEDAARLSALEKCLCPGCRSSNYKMLKKAGAAERADFLVATHWLGKEKELVECLQPRSLLILFDVGSTGGRREAWQQLVKQYQSSSVSFNLYDFGILFFLPDFQPAHYMVNYL